MIRYLILKKKGWRQIRIISRLDLLPADEVIVSLIRQAIEYLNSGNNWFHIDIDHSLIRYKSEQVGIKTDLGKLRKIKESSFYPIISIPDLS